jgi:hypothetical protein
LNRIPEYPKTSVNDIKEDEECLKKLQTIWWKVK